jgi:hypothetical protein
VTAALGHVAEQPDAPEALALLADRRRRVAIEAAAVDQLDAQERDGAPEAGVVLVHRAPA